MGMPKKIYPDNIRDSIVEIGFSARLPFEILLGIFFSSLDDNYHYTRSAMGSNVTGLFYNDTIKFEVRKNRLLFNCIKKYPGWEIYRSEIENALRQLNKESNFESFHKISVRYINELRGLSIRDITNFEFSFGRPEIESNRMSFSTEYDSGKDNIVLNIGETNFVNQAMKEDHPEKIAYIDIEVRRMNLQIKEIPEILQVLEDMHDKEKSVYSNLLTREFIEGLNPEY